MPFDIAEVLLAPEKGSALWKRQQRLEESKINNFQANHQPTYDPNSSTASIDSCD